MSYWKNFVGTEKRVRIIQGTRKRAIRVRAIDVILYVDPSAVAVYNENCDDIWSISTYSLTRSLCYAIHVRRYNLLASICNEYARQSL